jgi:hypothetical protein
MTWQHRIRSISVRPVNPVIEYLCTFLPGCTTLLANEEAEEIFRLLSTEIQQHTMYKVHTAVKLPIKMQTAAFHKKIL